MRQFNKPPLNVADQIKLLKQRGLRVHDDARAGQLLQVVTMFRLCPYMCPFEAANAEKHQFKAGATLADIVGIYRFDGELRQLFIAALERVEIAMRATISNHMCTKYSDAHWYLNKKHFQDRYRHDGLIKGIQDKQDKERADFQRERGHIERSRATARQKQVRIESRKRDNYARFYEASYDTPPLPPSWAMFEDLSMGAVSKLFQGLAKDNDRKIISRRFEVPSDVLVSWLHTLTFVRNICAHYGRLWNRELSIPPRLPKTWQLPRMGANRPLPDRRVYIVATMLAHLMPRISPDTGWRERFISLIESTAGVPLSAMGVPEDWRDQPQWLSIEPRPDDNRGP